MIVISGLGVALLLTFGVYIAMGEHLSVGEVMATLSIFSMAHHYASKVFGMVFHLLALIRAASVRIGKLLQMDEAVDYAQPVEGDLIASYEDATISWSKEPNEQKSNSNKELNTELAPDQKFSIRNISVRIRPGELVMVIGSVGSGKSTFLLGILRELYLFEGKLRS